MTSGPRTALLCLAVLAAAPATAAADASRAVAQPAQPALSAADQHDVSRVVDYLQGLTSERSRFVQTDARGARSEGVFYLQRPGRARFEYDPPSGLILAADGRFVTEVDRRLKTKHVYPLGSTPLALFLARNIRLDRGVTIRQVAHEGGGLKVTAVDGRRKTPGAITLTFQDGPLALTGWSLDNGRGGAVTIRLQGLAPAPPHDDSFFELPDPRTTSYPAEPR